MYRFALKLEYNGKPFCGWQSQPNSLSVQTAVENALRKLEPSIKKIYAAGRTDAGVHALGQVVHCELQKDWNTFRLREALNYYLKPLPVVVIDSVKVSQNWHARFSAIERHYLFRLVCRRTPVTHEKGLVWQIKHELDVIAMRKACAYLVGNHNFTTFRSKMCQAKSPVKTLDGLEVESFNGWSGMEIRFKFRARSFLHNQVRSIVGSLERVGAGVWQPLDIKRALQSCDRSACGPVSPPHGLYLTRVRYLHDPFIVHGS